MHSYNSPEQIAELLETQGCSCFTIYHTNKRDAAFRYYPEEPDIAKAKETMLQCPALIGPGKFWVELKPKKRAEKDSIVRIWMQTASVVPQENNQIAGIPQFDAQIKGLISQEVQREKKQWELEQEIRELKTMDKEQGLLQQLLSNPQVMQACQAILVGLAGKLMGGGSSMAGAIAGITNNETQMNAQQQEQQQEQQQRHPNERVIIAAAEIQKTIEPWGFDIVQVLENLAKMAEENPNKLRNALSFL